jgi:hypothetical protein
MAIEISGTFGPSGTNQNPSNPAAFPTHEANFGLGGYMQVADITERDAITTLRRAQGMSCWVISENKLYILKTGLTNTDWVELTSGGGGTPLVIQDEGVNIDTDTNLINFVGAGVTTTQTSAGEVEVSIPGSSGSVDMQSVFNASTPQVSGIDASKILTLGAGDINILTTTSSSGASEITIQSEDAVSGRVLGISIDAVSDAIEVSGIGTPTVGDVLSAKDVAGGLQWTPLTSALNLNHNKMWSGNASNEPAESDILEASNTADSNYFAIIGDADTSFQIGDNPNYVNFLTEIYSRQLTTLILGKNNNGAYNMGTSVIIGTEAVQTAPASIFGGNVVIGDGAASDHSGVGDYIKNSVIIGQNAGHVAVPSGTYTAALQSTVVGTGAGNRVGNNDVMIGHSAGSNALQKSGSFSQLLIGTATYGCGDGAIVLGGAVSSGIASFNGGIGETMGMSAGPRSTTDYYSTTIGYQSQALQDSISIGPNAGGNWDDNNGTDVNNIFIGSYAGQGSPTGDSGGDNNVVIGNNAFRYAGYDGKTVPGQTPNDADRNIIIGTQSGNKLRSNGNIAIGVYSLQSYYDTHYANYGNIAIGDEAAKDFEEEGNLNVFIGSEAATAITTGTQNVVIGGQAAMSAMSSQNVIIGHRAQYDNPTTGIVTGLVTRAVIIGEEAVNDSPTEEVYSVNIGANSVGTIQDCIVGANAIGYQGGIALGYNANQRNKGASGTNSYRNLVSLSPETTAGFNDATKGDANENGNLGNYCFFSNADALAAGLKKGDIFIESNAEGSNTPLDPARLCVVL